MKKNIVYLMLASLLLFTGCANYLDQDPEDLNSMDKIFSSKIETTKWYNRIYSDDFMVQEMHYSGQIPYFWCTDESAYILESHVRNIAEGKMSPDNYYGYTGYNLYFFVRYYQAIRHCNLFLENVDKCAELGEIDRRTMRAEARFMRAYYHYLLLRLYGPIPIVETSRSADQIGASQARNTLGECVRWINGEIDWACENGMPAARDEKFTLGLPTIGAARAIQSRMLLMVASPLFNGNSAYKNWTNHDGTVLMPQTYDKELWKDAADAAKTVIDMTEYQLLKPAADATFDEIVDNLRAVTTTWGAGKNTEIIWGHPNSVQWYGMCALPARWYGWNGRYSLAIGMIKQRFLHGRRQPEPPARRVVRLQEVLGRSRQRHHRQYVLDVRRPRAAVLCLGSLPQPAPVVRLREQDRQLPGCRRLRRGRFLVLGAERQRQHPGRQEHLGILRAQEPPAGLPQQQADQRGDAYAQRAFPHHPPG